MLMKEVSGNDLLLIFFPTPLHKVSTTNRKVFQMETQAKILPKDPSLFPDSSSQILLSAPAERKTARRQNIIHQSFIFAE